VTSARGRLPVRVAESLLVRPALFIAAGLTLAVACLWVDRLLGPEALPAWLQFDAESARSLYATLAGALLTVAGITFWVRSAIVSLAAAQFSANVVMGFLEDWYQQSVMSLMLGLFAYVVAVFRVIQPGEAGGTPDLAILVGIALAASSVVFVMGAIRNAVRSMYSGALGRRISNTVVNRIRTTLPLGEREGAPAPSVDPPAAPSVRVRAITSGWIGAIDEAALLAALPPGAVVQIEVRVGLFAIEGRPLAQVWAGDVPEEQLERLVRRVVVVGRRNATRDIEFGVQQLVDLAVGSLVGPTADVTSAYEVVQHLELVLWELGRRRLPPRVAIDERDRTLIRARHITYDDYVRLAYDRLRRTAVPYPTVSGALIVSAAEVARDLVEEGFDRRAAALRRQVEVILEMARHSDIVEEDLAQLQQLARRR
jgi:uncharacterized membrane protein